MNALTIPAKTMSSREIADLTGSTHDNVLKTVRALVEKGVVSANDTPYTHPQNGQTYSEFRLSYRDTMVVVSGYSVELRAKIIDRWQELEAGALVAVPQTLPEALRLAADLAEQNAAQAARLATVEPKALALDRISADTESMTFTQAAKLLGVKRKDLTAFMHASGWIYRQNQSWVAYETRIRSGHLQYKEAKYTDERTGQECHAPYCHILPKGLALLAERFSGQKAA